MSSALPSPDPAVNPETTAFWEATRERQLTVGFCDTCSRHFFYPRERCPLCGAPGAGLRPAAGTGTVYSATVTRRGIGAFADVGPYVLAYVELDEGPRVLTNIVGVAPESVRVGQRVRVAFDPTPGGFALPRFVPLESTEQDGTADGGAGTAAVA